MTDKSESETPRPRVPTIDPQVRRRRRRPSSVWIIPVVAAFLGGVLLYENYVSQGPLIKVSFETAEGIIAGKTEVRCRSVQVGTVEAVSLGNDLNHVLVTIRIDAEAEGLLKEDSRFWVVKPRFGGGGVSGLNTILSGPYIELDPGFSTGTQRVFAGMEQPPVTPQGFPGIHFSLIADEAGSLSVGSPITFKGLEVGRIESRTYDEGLNKVEFGGFVRAPYNELIYEDTKFWNTSGFEMQLDANGIQLRTGTIETIFSGGVSFDSPLDGAHPIFPITATKQKAADGSSFRLYSSFTDTRELNLENCPDYLLLFEDSVRGLSPGAPVEFRGIQVGMVTEVSLNYRLLGEDPGPTVPVFIRIDPMRLRLTDFPLSATEPATVLAERERIVFEAVQGGLRASLKTGNFITGQLFVDLEFDGDSGDDTVRKISKFNVLPTKASSLAQIQESLTNVLEKIEDLPIKQVLEGAVVSLEKINETAEEFKLAADRIEILAMDISKFVKADNTQKVPEELVVTLNSLRETLADFDEKSVAYKDLTNALNDFQIALRSFTALTDKVGRQPNSLIFGGPKREVDPPKAKKPF